MAEFDTKTTIVNKPVKCCFIGHRKIEVTDRLIAKINLVIEDLIKNHNVQIFLFGSKSEFNSLCHNIVTQLKEKYPYIKRIYYTCKHERCILEKDRNKYESLHKEIVKSEIHILGFEEEFEHKTKYTAGKASYIERNYAMINTSDYCIFYYNKDYQPELTKYSNLSIGYPKLQSGTRLAFNYAIKKEKIIVNLYNLS